jgi:hypothetical protein
LQLSSLPHRAIHEKIIVSGMAKNAISNALGQFVMKRVTNVKGLKEGYENNVTHNFA